MSSALVHALREGLYLAVLLAAPPVLAVLAAGLVAAFLQTVTQVRDASLSAVPKLIAALAALAVTGPWIGAQAMTFFRAVLSALPAAGRS
jgi:flagellar biosynthesis protein FliQ